MAFLNQLSEKLEAQQIYNGMKGKYETRFKVEGAEYAFLATSVAGDAQDNTQWMLEFENIKSHRIGVGDGDKKVVKAFAEAVNQWVKETNPFYFYTYGSHIDSIKAILESVKKKVKGYNVVDATEETKDESGNVIEGNPVGKIVWTKMVEQETVPSEEKADTPQTDLEQTYEEPKDIKTDKKFMSGTSKSDKLDKGDKAYELKTESFAEFKAKKLDEFNDTVDDHVPTHDMSQIQIEDLDDFVIDGKYPDLFVAEATWADGTPLSDEELDALNAESEFVHELAQKQKYG